MVRLRGKENIAQQIAEAIATALEIEVEIIDDELVRVAGTGQVHDDVGRRLMRGFVNKYVLSTGNHVFIESAGYHPLCSSCPLSGKCFYRASIVYPIMAGDKVIGTIGLIAFNEEQRSRLLTNSGRLVPFIARMADLVTSKLSEEEMVAEKILMANQLQAIVDSIYEGILAVDNNGIITHVNRAAEKMLGVDQKGLLGQNIRLVLPIKTLLEALENQRGFTSREVAVDGPSGKVRLICTARPILDREGKMAGLVASFRDFKETQRLAYRIMAGEKEVTFDDIVGASPALQKVKREAQKIAISDSTVLILGESGTGKELFARAIHAASPRRNRPFVAINCGAIPENLLESELFGYEEGAFSGARRGGKPGKFELADGGTIFLDEIGNMSLYLQAKLLRVLQERTIDRVGGTTPIRVDVRVIAATNSDLEDMVKKGQFRADLYYRLSVIPLVIPPLRERREDIPLLLEHYLNRFNALLGKNITGFSKEALELCQNYDWPGNVRELANAVEYAVNLEEGSVITVASLPERIQGSKEKTSVFAQHDNDRLCSLVELEKEAIVRALRKFGWSEEGKYQAAKALGISRATLYRKLKKYGLKKELCT